MCTLLRVCLLRSTLGGSYNRALALSLPTGTYILMIMAGRVRHSECGCSRRGRASAQPWGPRNSRQVLPSSSDAGHVHPVRGEYGRKRKAKR